MKVFHFKFDWKIGPRVLWNLTSSIDFPLMIKAGGRSSSLVKQTTISLYLPGFNFMSLAKAHELMLSNSNWSTELPFTGTTSEIVMSSTYFQLDVVGEDELRSFIINRKIIGPNLVPCGTPAVIGSHWEMVEPILTACRRQVRKLQIHGMMDLRTPILISFWTTKLWLILSIALLKSKKTVLK